MSGKVKSMAGNLAHHHPETLQASWYCDEAIFARERKVIFARNWTLLARQDQLARPGDYVSDEVTGWPVFVIRDRDGELKGYHNVCRHRAGPILAPGAGRCNLRYGLRCRYHGWTYDLAGRLKKAPGFADGEDFDRSQFKLFSVRVETWKGLIFVCLDEDAPDLESWLGDIVEVAREFRPIEEMAFFREVTMEGNANWKLYGDNGVEGYHLPFVHTALSNAVAGDAYNVELHENGEFVGFRVQYDAWDQGRETKGYWIYKFPCLLVHFSELDFNVEQVTPLAPGRVRLRHWFWFPKDDGDQTLAERIVDDWAITMREDLGISEAVQHNLEAGVYEMGRLTPAREKGTIFFQKLVREALADGK